MPTAERQTITGVFTGAGGDLRAGDDVRGIGGRLPADSTSVVFGFDLRSEGSPVALHKRGGPPRNLGG